jgi:hypothetical protein
MNFSESLTYWYLRLNGFFPLSNFVLHRRNIEDRPSADTDLLAIRFPHVFEQIGGQQDDWDQQQFAGWGLRLDEPEDLVEGLRVRSAVTRDAWSVAKLLVSNVPRPADSWLNLTLDDAKDFIRQRIHNYQVEKRADRLSFRILLCSILLGRGK